VGILGLVALASVVGTTLIAVYHGEIPPVLSGLATSAITTLGVIAVALYGNGGRVTSGGHYVYIRDEEKPTILKP
jgi:hypothetical protein